MIPEVSRIASLGELLRDAMRTYKSNLAMIEANRHREVRRLTYADVLVEAETLAVALQRHLAPGERCAILMSNQSRWAIGAMAGLFSGAVLVPLDYKLAAKDQLALLAHAGPRVLLVEYPVYLELRKDLEEAPNPVQLFVSDVPGKTLLGAGAVRFPEGDLAIANRCDHRRRTREDLACVVYTSGTGGQAKGCMLTHNAYLEQAQSLGRLFPMDETDRYLSVLPTNHAIDFMCSMVIPYLYGATVVYQRTLRAEFLVSTMKRYRVTHTALVPRILKALRDGITEQIEALAEWKQTLLKGLIEINELATMATPNHILSRTILYPVQQRFGGRLRMIIAGGAYVDPELARFFYRLGWPVVIGYGLTESCVVLTVNDLSPFRPDTVGRPVAGVELEVRDAGKDGVGEIYASGPSIMTGYLNAPEATEEVLVGGWLRTGDLGWIDRAGHLHIRGRAKNMIVTDGGKNVYPEDVEAALGEIVCEELCVLAESFVWPASFGLEGARLTAVVRPKQGQGIAEVRAALVACNQSLQDYKRLGSFVICTEAFPVTASMKVKRAELAQWLRGSNAQRHSLMEAALVR